MSGKFMRVRKLVLSTFTVVMIASQLMGCSAATSGELMTMVQNNEEIEIEIAEPINNEQGVEVESITWEELASLKTNDTLRKGWDNTLSISAIENGKNGMLYVDAEGNQVNNNTLYVALHNRQFQKALEDQKSDLVKSAVDNYGDLEAVSDEDKTTALLMGINGYFDLLPDNTPNYSNPDSTIERNEFMSMLYRANNPVSEISEDKAFSGMVGDNKFNLYAQGSLTSSYLDTASKSLDNLTYNGTITRAEAIYSIVQTYFADEYKNVDINASTYSDCKNGGNIIQKSKGSGDVSGIERGKAYELTYALQNPDSVGMPTDLYKAMVVAKQKSLIDGGISRWDEGLTKAEAIDILVKAIEQDDSMESFNNLRAAVDIKDETDDSSVSVDFTGIDGAGIDGEIQEGEYSQADSFESDTAENTTDVAEINNDKINIDPDSIPTSEIGAYLDSLTQDEISAMDPDVLTELIYRDLYGDESGSNSSGSNYIPGTVEGATPDNGSLGDYEFGQGGEVHEEAKGQLQH